MRQQLIWNKDRFVLGRQDYQWKHETCLYGWKPGAAHKWCSDRSQMTVIDCPRPKANRDHPTMKPIPLFDYLIRNSTDVGDTVYDPFCGSGTTLPACEQANRKCGGGGAVAAVLRCNFTPMGDADRPQGRAASEFERVR
ncbi:MAG: DNA methyltransferase [Butyricicoccaceae bacterium]